MIGRRLVALIASAAALGGYALWSDDGTLLRWAGLAEQAPSKVASAQVEIPTVDIPAKPTVALNPLSNLPIEALGEMVARPLFNPTRAPAPPPVENASSEPEPPADAPAEVADDTVNPEDFTLLAVVSTDGSKTALVRWNVNNQMFQIKEGDLVSDWQLTQVALRDVTLSRNGKTLQLKLFQKLPAGAQPPAQVAQPSTDEMPPDAQ